jgi:hypothetical protein
MNALVLTRALLQVGGVPVVFVVVSVSFWGGGLWCRQRCLVAFCEWLSLHTTVRVFTPALLQVGGASVIFWGCALYTTVCGSC